MDFQIDEELKKLPAKPGVYIMHDAHDTIIYVGKAVVLKNRVRQYFQKGYKRSPKIEHMVSQIERFEYIVTDSELEALVLESNLIKEHRPKYNTMLKDDKAYPYIRVTVQEDFPRVMVARSRKKDGARYFGPYTNATAVRDIIELLRKLYSIRSCSRVLPRDIGKDRPCLYHHIGQCGAPCQGYISKEQYRENVQKLISFLKGRVEDEIAELTEKMMKASEDMRFEEAARYRDLIESIKELREKQKITGTDGDDRDIIAIAMDHPSAASDPELGFVRNAVIQVFFVRGGKLIGREHFFLTADDTDDPREVVRAFISQYYASTPMIPKELMLETDIPDRELLEQWLTSRRGSKVTIRIPQKGLKEKLVEMAKENADIVLSRDRERLRREEMRTLGAVREIRDLLGIPCADRMESYDISNISGADSVGSMIVYEKGRPKRSDYRKFRIKWVEGPNDYASMEEVLTRRYTRAKEGDPSFARLPDVILMDGGKGQVHAAEHVLHELGFNIPVAGMVKDDFHRTRGLYFHDRELPIKRDSEGFKLLTRIQDEVHRFAIEYHRLLRSKGQVHSVLDDIEGIGPARRKALLRTFKTTEAIRDASVEELLHAPSMNEAAAENVYRFFHPDRRE
ncbi:MAG: excinuclease ABC subunit UvrC [Lachnospiraceae bacterium]|jgi:excinuclease ABC subunit C|nr:excinuclease ABC subunit UvrC [Lachnospiraceae bacterium]MEE3438291.1 excinuclease ABC subunit UvrC [Lachnospiraceae bacterium]